MDLSALQGRKVALYISTMGDQGSGTITGGRYSVDALIRGSYQNNPEAATQYSYPLNETTSSITADALSSVTRATSLLNAPASAVTRSKGAKNERGIGLTANGSSDYRNETLITNPRDVSFLTNLVQTIFYLRGIDVVSPEHADTDVFVTVDVFGTIRSRTELHIYNAETLKAQTKLEYFAVDRNSRTLLIKPTASAYETQYKEKYALWSGPYKTAKTVKVSDGLMVSFADIEPYGGSAAHTRPAWQQNRKPSRDMSDAVARQRQQGE